MSDPFWRRALPPGFLVLLVALVMHLFWAVRFSRLAEWDTAATTWTINSVIQSGKLVPDRGLTYWNGYTYQVLGASLVYWTGWDLSYLQVAVSPVLGLVPIGLLLLLYRELLPSGRMAALAGLAILLQADFLFITSRGSHEKVTLTLLALVLLALTRAYTSSTRLADFVPWLLVFYLGTFALLSTNIFFAGSFLATLAIAATTALVLEQRGLWRPERSFQPLVYTLLACLVIEFLIIFYIYPPSQSTLQVARSMSERIVLLLFEIGERQQQVTPYSLVTQAWVWPYTWVVLRLADALILVTAALGWLRLLRSRAWQTRPQYTLVLIFSLALAVQFFVAIVADYGGGSGIRNTQVRIFPVLTLLGAPLSAYWLQSRWQRSGDRLGRVLRYAALALLPLLVVAALVKATNDPVLSNTWMFYGKGERLALGWLHEGPSLWSRLQWRIWAGIDSRLVDTYVLYYASWSNRFIPLGGENIFGTSYDLVLMSPLIEAQAVRAGRGMLDLSQAHRLYDNGAAQVYDARRPLFTGLGSPPRRVNLNIGRAQ